MDATDPGQRNTYTVVGVKSLGFKNLIRGELDARQGPDLAVGKNSVYIEDNETDAAGAFSSGEFHSLFYVRRIARGRFRIQLSFSHCILPSPRLAQ